MTERAPKLAAQLIIGIVGVAILVALGVWQVERLAWKRGLIGDIERRLNHAPVVIPSAIDAERDAFLRVQANGRLGEGELHALSAVKALGPGYRIVKPFVLTDDGRTASRVIMVDLGFVPERMKDAVEARASASADDEGFPDAITGILHWPGETDIMTPEPDLGRNIWFARDVEAMARTLGTEAVLLVAESHPLGAWPRPRPPGADLTNNHLQYALTWFSLAVVWAVMTLVWIRAERRRRRTPAA